MGHVGLNCPTQVIEIEALRSVFPEEGCLLFSQVEEDNLAAATEVKVIYLLYQHHDHINSDHAAMSLARSSYNTHLFAVHPLEGHMICYSWYWVAVRCLPVEEQTRPDSSAAQCDFQGLPSAANLSLCALFFLHCIPMSPLHSRQGPGSTAIVPAKNWDTARCMTRTVRFCKLSATKHYTCASCHKDRCCMCRLNVAPAEESMMPLLMSFTSVLRSKQAQRCYCWLLTASSKLSST